MILTIPTGKHRPLWWWLQSSFGYNKTIIRRKVVFGFNSIYDHKGADQYDINKLFGISLVEWYRLVWICISWPVFALLSRNRHHQDSVRVGYWYDLQKNKFIICAYCYVEGQRITRDICGTYANKELRIDIRINPSFYELSVYQYDNDFLLGCVSIPYWHKNKCSIALGLFFGGNQPAPHTMNIEIKKL